MRKLVRVIDSHVELVDLEVTSNLHAGAQSAEDVQTQLPPTPQPIDDAPQLPPTDPLT